MHVEALLEEEGGGVHRMLGRMVGDEADDCWSESVLRLLRAWPESDVDVRAWWYTVAANVARDCLRRRSRGDVELLEHHLVTVDDAGRSLIRDEEARWLAGLVAMLPPGQARAVSYRYLVGLSGAEAATLMGVSAEAARKRTSDGLAGLRRLAADDPRTARLFDSEPTP